MNILFAANDQVIDGLELAIWTLLTYNKHVNIYIATMNISLFNKENNSRIDYYAVSEEQRQWLKKIVKYLDNSSNICFIDCESYYHDLIEGGINENTGFTPYASLRLLADKILPNINDILYLDADVAIQDNIESMYHQYLIDNPYTYAISCAYGAFNGQGEDVSGVFLMNLNKMRRLNFLDNARKLYKKNKYVYPDQMAIRDTGPGMRLPETYGYMEPIESAPYKPIILHFTNNLKPKIYNRSIPNIKDHFYKRFPQFKYVQDGLELLKTFKMYL